MLSFDLEIAVPFPDEGDVDHSKLGISCAAMASDDGKTLTVHSEFMRGKMYHDRMTIGECRQLARALSMQPGPIITWNGNFDFHVLACECHDKGLYATCQAMALKMIDPMFEMVCRYGYPIGLAKASVGMSLGEKAGMTGEEAPYKWRVSPEEQAAVLRYVQKDADLTLALYEAIKRNGFVAWTSDRGNLNRKPLGCLTVEECLTLPHPDTSWMSDPGKWAREKFVGWLES